LSKWLFRNPEAAPPRRPGDPEKGCGRSAAAGHTKWRVFKDAVEAFVASSEWDQGTLSRLAFWVEVLGEREIAAISADDIDAGLLKLAERGRFKAGKRAAVRSGKPLSGSTMNRYLTQAGSAFREAVAPRTFVPPTRRSSANGPPSGGPTTVGSR